MYTVVVYLWRCSYENESTRSCCHTYFSEHFQQWHFGPGIASDDDNGVDSDANGTDDDNNENDKRKKSLLLGENENLRLLGYAVKFMQMWKWEIFSSLSSTSSQYVEYPLAAPVHTGQRQRSTRRWHAVRSSQWKIPLVCHTPFPSEYGIIICIGIAFDLLSLRKWVRNVHRQHT